MLKDRADGESGTKILLDAMSKDKVHLARFVLDALDGEIVDSQTEDAQTPLISSILLPDSRNRCKFMELLLQKGASVNCQDGAGRTALSYACEKGYLDAVKILVRNNADPDVVDTWGNTALMYAAAAGHAPIVEFLVRAFKRLGLQIGRQNKAGNSAVEVAKFLGHTECMFALMSNSRRSRESDGGAQQPRHSLISEFERKVGNLADTLEVLQTCDDDSTFQKSSRQQRHRIKPNRLPSMDSIEEFHRENDGSSFHPQRNCNLYTHIRQPKAEDSAPNPGDHLPPLIHSREAQKSIFFSPRPNRNNPQPGPPSTLDILLTPILANKTETGGGTETFNNPDLCRRRFNDSYYKKRCSLPTSMLSPTPPERTLMSVRKSKTVKRPEGSPGLAEPLELTPPAANSTATTFSVLSNKLFRRFTSPEFKKGVRDLELNPELTSGRIPRSETFPQVARHPQVDSTPSIDSISAVKCEFDIHFKKTNP